MEPVPETERMEFQPSPLPNFRRQNPPALLPSELDIPRKPANTRWSTDPQPPFPSWTPPTSIPYRPRTTSPLSGSHVRSRSATSLAPAMTRAHSLPGANGPGQFFYSPQLRPQSPLSSPNRARTPRKPVDEVFPSSPTRVSVHDPERKVTERSVSPSLGLGSSPSAQFAGAPIQRLRRPSSPLRYISHPGASPPSSVSSPSLKSYDSLSSSYAPAAAYPWSSMPSTPTSTRSRSPSISSLETIPDTPDAEEAALEAERVAQLKAAAEAAEGGDSKGKGGGLDALTRGRTLAFGSRDKRKRWSVCGAERRGDLDLETIWED